MKRSTFTRVSALALIAAMSFSACSKKEPAELKVRHKDLDEKVTESEPEPAATTTVETTAETTEYIDETTTTATSQNDGDVITIYTYTDDVSTLCNRFQQTHPDFPYTFNIYQLDTYSGYSEVLASALGTGNEAPDIFAVDDSFYYDYFVGDVSPYTAPYKDFGIDVENAIVDAQIAPYIAENGRRTSDGEIVGLTYSSSGCFMIYRTDIAEEVFGTSDPDEIADLVGAGSGSWDKFKSAAVKLDAAGYSALSGVNDLWVLQRCQSTSPWAVNGEANISAENAAFLDLALEFNEYTNQSGWWSESWYADMSGTGERPVFAFFGPEWMLDFSMGMYAGDTLGKWNITEAPLNAYWGSTWIVPSSYAAESSSDKRAAIGEFLYWMTLDTSDDGAQAYLASGECFDGCLTQVASAVVQENYVIDSPVLGGQADQNSCFADASQSAVFHPKCKDSDYYDSIFLSYVMEYLWGDCTKEEALQDLADDIDYNVAHS